MRYTGNTAGALPETFAVPSQVVWYLVAHVDYRRTSIQFNGTNIADRHYVAICTRSVACSWPPGRAVSPIAGRGTQKPFVDPLRQTAYRCSQ
ncbi:hypothetical protein [Gluconacetobacter aggeris]|uniref:hypothetical protein n=1 Tax=Gluconacetobacter aggeris TaxID=1286186 RepID=UPI001FE8218E|nr:hypothetical protein [Gluconacetobacter aggeris]